MEKSPYDRTIAKALDLDLDYFQDIMSRMNMKDWQLIYFLSGGLIAYTWGDANRVICDDERNKKSDILKIISKYQRKEKFLILLKE